MSIYIIEPLWSQGGGEQIIGAIIFLLLVIAQILKAYFDARSTKIGEEKKHQKSIQKQELDDPFNNVLLSQTAKPSRERKRIARKQNPVTKTVPENIRKTRGTLSRELAPQGEGSRFETTTGTLDASQIVTPSISPTVKSTLESMTGIYETPPANSELQSLALTLALDINKIITSPEGLRHAVILSEILKRPNF
ncbi:MAG: hypothetical protein LBP87_13215 [Planctomycetaceae bacterium]|jgi:hypothetical protein|nr:hypothetical protein [Planctomycetaceae bacterium]